MAFTVTAEGTGLTYQWQYSADGENWTNCKSGGYNTDTFSFQLKASLAGRQYRCVVKSGTQTVYSEPALVELASTLTIVSQPAAVTAAAGEAVSFNVAANRSDVTYQWQYSVDGGMNWKNCSSAGALTDTFGFTMKASFSGRLYRCKVSDGSSTLYSDAAIVSEGSTISITQQPADVSVAAGEKVTLTVAVSASDVTYQWQYSVNGGGSWKNCGSGGYDTDTFTFTMKETFSGRQYRCVVSQNGADVVSQPAVITLATAEPLQITQQPQPVSAAAGESVSFSVAVNLENASYQWQYSTNGGTSWRNCSSGGYNKPTFSFTMKPTLGGRLYRCIVSYGTEQEESEAALVTFVEDSSIQ